MGRPARLVRISTRAGHGWDSSARTGCASSRASGRNNDNDSNNHIDNGNTAAIIASRLQSLPRFNRGNARRKSGGGTHASEPTSPDCAPAAILVHGDPGRFLEGFAGFGTSFLPDNGRQPRLDRAPSTADDNKPETPALIATLPATYRRLGRSPSSPRCCMDCRSPRRSYPGQAVAKAAMGILLLAAGSTCAAPRERAWLCAALVTAVLGDVLALPDWPLSFVLGLGAFLLTHLALRDLHALARAAARLAHRRARRAVDRRAGVLRGVLPAPRRVDGTGRRHMLVQCAMASFALAARTRGPLVAIGSLIFVGSDTLIGVGRFLGGFRASIT